MIIFEFSAVFNSHFVKTSPKAQNVRFTGVSTVPTLPLPPKSIQSRPISRYDNILLVFLTVNFNRSAIRTDLCCNDLQVSTVPLHVHLPSDNLL